jgi:hypothetical protein
MIVYKFHTNWYSDCIKIRSRSSKDQLIWNTLLALKFASYSFSHSFKFAHLVETYSRCFKLIRANNFPCSFFLVRLLIELLTQTFVNKTIIIMSIFDWPQVKLCTNIFEWPQKMASKSVCNVSEIHDIAN